MSVSRDYIWNTTAGIINASEAVIMAMVTTRMGTIEEAGILSIAFAIGNLLMTIGKFGARVFHSTDIKQNFKFRTYLLERWITVIAMGFVMGGYVWVQRSFGGWSISKVISIILICGIYMVESVEDCIWGELQRRGYLYVGGRMFTARWLGILLSFTAVMTFCGNLALALGISLVASVIIFLICILIIRRCLFINDVESFLDNGVESHGSVFSLLRQTVPFFLSAFCVLYLNNAPKFAIDRTLSDAEQACFGFVAMPVFVIALVNQFVYQPYLVVLSKEWNNNKIALFRKRIRRQMGILSAISAICIIGAAIIGIPVLSWLYSTDLSAYRRELVILQMSGFFLALSGYFSVILTTMRKGNKLLFGYFVTMALSFLLMGTLTGRYGTLGASTGYMLLMIVLCMIDMVIYAIIIKRRTIEQFECGRV